jgi:hypothetical protein
MSLMSFPLRHLASFASSHLVQHGQEKRFVNVRPPPNMREDSPSDGFIFGLRHHHLSSRGATCFPHPAGRSLPDSAHGHASED